MRFASTCKDAFGSEVRSRNPLVVQVAHGTKNSHQKGLGLTEKVSADETSGWPSPDDTCILDRL